MRKFLLLNGLKMSFVRGATLTLLLIFLTGFSYGASLFGDQTKNFVIKNKNVQQAIEQILDKSGYYVVYAVDNIKSLGTVSAEYNNVTTEEALKNVLSSKGLTFTIKDNNVVITKTEAVSQQQNQKITIMGRVIDASTKKPISGATILIIGTPNGAISDDKGNFSFTANVGQEIEASYVGMKSVTRKITADDKNITIELQHDAMAVEDVVVTGIFNKAKESYTGAVTSVSSKELKMYKGQNILATLKNIDPSFNIVANNNFGSNPNRLPEVNIRGNSSLPMTVKELNEGARAQLNAPLVIMDGFEITLQKLMDYNDEEIENINILKDAAATAIYGSRGANGVIVVVTKTPVSGKLMISVKAGMSLEMPDLSSYDLLNAKEKLQLERINGLYNSETPTEDSELQDKYFETLNNVMRGVDTYWLGQPVRTGIGQDYNIGLTGGNDEFKWKANIGYKNIMGVMKDSQRDNFSGSVSLSYSLNKVIFKNQTSITSNKGSESKYGSFKDYTTMNPYWRIHDERGYLIKSYNPIGAGYSVGNPLYNSTLNIVDNNTITEIINNFSIEWDIISALKFRAQFGISKSFNNSNKFLPAEHTAFDKYSVAASQRRGSYDYGSGEGMNYDANATLTYFKSFDNDKHQLYAGVDYSMAQKKSLDFLFQAEGFPDEDLVFLSNALQYKEGTKPSGEESVVRRIGFTANINYTFDNRLFIDLSGRIDGSSQFGSKNRFAPFWSAGIGWNLHNEKFISNKDLFSRLRLKGSYGQTGSQQFGAYQSLQTLKYFSDKKYLIWNAAELMGLGNENLKWQMTDQMNVGMEVGFWNNRLSATFDYYTKKTSDLLSQMDIPLSQGFSSYADNVGALSNKGFEASATGFILRDLSRDISWSVTGKIAYNKNNVDKLSDAIKSQNEAALNENVEINKLLFEGHPVNSAYAVRSMGIDPSTGNEIFIDKNGNIAKTWNAGDRIYMGSLEPKYRGNFSTLFSYKGLSLNLSFGYHFGGKQYNETLVKKVEVAKAGLKNNLDRRVLTDRWQKPGDIKFFKRIDGEETKMTSRFVMSDNVFELQSANLSYRLATKNLLKKAKIQSVTFSLDMSDVFYISSVKMERGIEYPFARRVGLSISLLF